MAKFCTRCGRPLPENGICGCMESQAGPVKMEAANRTQEHQTVQAQNQQNSQPQQGQMPQGQPYQSQGQQNRPQQGQPQHSQLYQGQYQQGQPYQGQAQRGQQPYQGQYQQGQSYQGQGQQPYQGQYQQSQPYQGQAQRGQQMYQGQYQQGQPYQGQYQQGQYQQGQPYGNSYNMGMTKEAEWFNEKKDALISVTRNMFSEILPILKAPVTRVQKIASTANPAVGLEFVAAKTVVVVMIILIALMVLKNEMGVAGDYVKIPYFRILFAALLLTAGVDCLEAFFLKIFTGVFNGRTDYASMITVVGARSLYEGIVILIAALFLLLSPGTASIVILVGTMIFPYIEFAGYMAVAKVKADRKPYAFFVVKICMSIVFLIIAYIFINDVVSSIAGNFSLSDLL